MAIAIGGILIVLGIIGVKYGIEAIIIGLTFLAIALGLKSD